MKVLTKEEGMPILAARLRDDLRPRPVIFLGAGASVSSGVPNAADCVLEIARWYYQRIVLQGAMDNSTIDNPLFRQWMQVQSWYQNRKNLAECFPDVVDQLLVPASERAKILKEVTKIAHLSDGYRRLVDLVDKYIFKTILTTNFDECLTGSFREMKPLVRVAEINRSPGDTQEFNIDGHQIVWLHGRIEQYSDQNTSSEIVKLDKKMMTMVEAILHEAPLIVIGYRGSEYSIMQSLLLRLARKRKYFKHGIYWCTRDSDLHFNVIELANKVGKDFFCIKIDDFDSLMDDLSWKLLDSDFSQLPAPGIWSDWIDCIAREKLAVFVYDQNEFWKIHDLDRKNIIKNDDHTMVFENKIAGDMHRYAKISCSIAIKGDFDAEIELCGDFLDLQLQIADGADRNIYVTPKRQGIDVSRMTRYCIHRRGHTIKFGIMCNGQKKTLNQGFYEPPGDEIGRIKLGGHDLFIAIALNKEARVLIKEFLIRTKFN